LKPLKFVKKLENAHFTFLVSNHEQESIIMKTFSL